MHIATAIYVDVDANVLILFQTWGVVRKEEIQHEVVSIRNNIKR